MLKTKSIQPGKNLALCFLLLCVLSACSTFRTETKDSAPIVPRDDQYSKKIPAEPIPRYEPRSKYGNPSSYVVFGKRYYTLPNSKGFVQRGIASWYGKKFHGRRTSSGEPYDMYAMTAAHTQLPLPTYVQVTNLRNGKQVILRVNDRGPFHGNRIIDLSYSAAVKLDIVREGTGLVEVRAIDPSTFHTNQYKYIAVKNNKGNESKRQRDLDMQDASVHSDTITIPPNSPKVFIQVGAFGQRENAAQLKNQLSTLNIGEVFISSVIKDSKQLHRVRIGPLSTVELADQTVSQLRAMGMKDHRVVIE